MTLTSKDRAQLRAQANKLKAIYSLGKDGVTPEFIAALETAIEARELVKVNILQNCDEDPVEAAHAIAKATRAEVVQVIGGKFTLYRKNPDKHKPAPIKATPKANPLKKKRPTNKTKGAKTGSRNGR